MLYLVVVTVYCKLFFSELSKRTWVFVLFIGQSESGVTLHGPLEVLEGEQLLVLCTTESNATSLVLYKEGSQMNFMEQFANDTHKEFILNSNSTLRVNNGRAFICSDGVQVSSLVTLYVFCKYYKHVLANSRLKKKLVY